MSKKNWHFFSFLFDTNKGEPLLQERDGHNPSRKRPGGRKDRTTPKTNKKQHSYGGWNTKPALGLASAHQKENWHFLVQMQRRVDCGCTYLIALQVECSVIRDISNVIEIIVDNDFQNHQIFMTKHVPIASTKLFPDVE